MRKALFGAGGFSRDIKSALKLDRPKLIPRLVDDQYWTPNNDYIYPLSESWKMEKFILLIAVADPWDRQAIVNRFPEDQKYWSFVDRRSIFLDGRLIFVGKGSAICAGSIIVCNSRIGNHTHINLASTIGHDTNLGNFVTVSPGVNISGDCEIGDRVFFGTNSCVREKVHICDDVTIGMGAVVIHDITEPGTYVGNPAKRIYTYDSTGIDLPFCSISATVSGH